MTESAKTGPLRFGSENQLNFTHKYIVIRKQYRPLAGGDHKINFQFTQKQFAFEQI